MADTELLNNEVREVPCKTETNAAAALSADADLSGGVPASDTSAAEEHLCAVTFFDSESNPNWTGDALSTTVQELNAALTKENGHAPDARRVLDILAQLNADDVQRIEAAYAGIYGEPLRDVIKENIPENYRKAELILEADYPAHAAYAFEQKDSGYLMLLMSTLPSAEVEKLKTDFNTQYGAQFESFDKAVEANFPSAAERYLINDVFANGSDALSPENRALAAEQYLKLLMESPFTRNLGEYNLERFDLLIGGVGPNDFATRKILNENPDFVANYRRMFEPRTWGAGIPAEERYQSAVDLLQDGKISLASLIRQNSYQGLESFLAAFNGGYRGANWEAIDTAIKGIDPEHRADYLAGKALAATTPPENWSQLPFEQRRQVMYYDQLERAFKDRGDDTQELVWRDMLLNGDKTLLSKLAETNRDGGNIDDFMQVMAGVSAEDWRLLQPVDGSPSEYRAALDGAIGSIQNPEIQQKVREMVAAFAGTENFDSTVVQRDFISTLRHNQDNGEENRFASIASALLKMSPEEAALYADPDHPEYRAEIDSILFPQNVGDFNFTNEGQEAAAVALSQRILKYVAEHGTLPAELDEEMTFMKGVMEGTVTDQALRTKVMNQYLGDEETRAKMEFVMSEQYGAFSREDLANITPEDYATYWYVFGLQGTNMDFHSAVRNGGVSSSAQIQSGEGVGEGEGIYTDILRNREYNQEFIDDMPADERALLDYVEAQGGTMDFVAQARAFALNSYNSHDYKYFVEQLAAKSPDEIAAFLETYKTLTPDGTGDFTADFLSAAKTNDRVSDDVLQVLTKIAEQGMEVRLEDRIRLAYLSGEKNYQQFLPELEALDETEAGAYGLKTGYARYGDVAGDLLGMIDQNNGDRVKYGELLKVGASDPRMLMLEQYDAMDLTGWDTDGTREAMVEALRDKQHLLANYYAARENIPQELLAELDAQFYSAVQANRDSKASAAAMVDQMISWTVAVTAIGAIPFSGGTSLMFTGGAMAVSASRPFVMPAVLGEQMTQDQFNQQLATMGFELATLGVDVAAQAFIMYKSAMQRPMMSQALTKLSDDAAAGMPENVTRSALVNADAATGVNADVAGGALTRDVPYAEFTVLDDPLVPRLTGPDSVDLPPKQALVPINVASVSDNALPRLNAKGDLEVPSGSLAISGKTNPTLADVGYVPDSGDAIAFPDLADLYGLARPKAFSATDNSIPRIAALDDAVEAGTSMLRIKPSMITTPFLVAAEASDLTSFDPGISDTEQEETDFTPKPDLIEMATVKRGEGPWQTAERILAAAGGKYDVMEVRALANAIKAIYAADSNNPDIAGLKVNHQFITEGNFEQLLNSVDNEVVKTALMSFAA